MSDRQTKKSRKARADGVETREAIIAAAEGEFAEKGFELASAREICRRAGVNSALLSRYFGSKDALYRIVAKRLFGDLGAPLAALADGVTDDASWRGAVREWVDDMLFMTIPTERAQKLCQGFTTSLTIETPGKLISHNGKQLASDKVTWTLSLENMPSGELFAEWSE